MPPRDAVTYVVQHWIGDNNALDWDLGPNGVWRTFLPGTETNGEGGHVQLKLCDAPVTARFVRVLRTKPPILLTRMVPEAIAAT
jgi:hypothetical protein